MTRSVRWSKTPVRAHASPSHEQLPRNYQHYSTLQSLLDSVQVVVPWLPPAIEAYLATLLSMSFHLLVLKSPRTPTRSSNLCFADELRAPYQDLAQIRVGVLKFESVDHRTDCREQKRTSYWPPVLGSVEMSYILTST